MDRTLAQPSDMDDLSPVDAADIQEGAGAAAIPGGGQSQAFEMVESPSEDGELPEKEHLLSGSEPAKEDQEDTPDISALAAAVNDCETKSHRMSMAGVAAFFAIILVSLWGFSTPKLVKWTVGPACLFCAWAAVDSILETKEQKLRSICKEHGVEVLEQVIDVAAQRKIEMMELDGSLEAKLQDRIIQKLDTKSIEPMD